uniref:cytochrome P450 10-like isoform X2 n=1 Tax=Ciona intestinalis TaxID=7719 RepID=UPI000EF4EE98|nr:cytochrome P450 10-like isoform X2 [Ciona intestinalis]|eukprot:XP_026693179.1 cytochrome P450 10-like isoform X2 [Ciona intestinalis]
MKAIARFPFPALVRFVSTCPAHQRAAWSKKASQEDLSYAKPFEAVPEPNSYPVIGTALEYTPLNNFNPSYVGEHWIERHKELGPIYKENILPGVTETMVFTSSPQNTEIMFRNEERCPFRDPLGPVAKIRDERNEYHGLTNSNGEDWWRVRQIVNQHFLQNTAVWKYAEAHRNVSKDFLKFIDRNMDEKNEVPNFGKALNRWSFEGAGVFTLKRRLGALDIKPCTEIEEMINCNERIFQSMGELLYALPFWKYVNTKDMKKLRQALQEQYNSTETHILRILKDKDISSEGSILHNQCLSDSEKVILMTEFLVAGIDTTSNSAAFLLYALASNQEAQERLREEVREVNRMDTIDGKLLHNMKYLQACLRETQRMFPFVNSSPRRFRKDLVLSGYLIPAGTHILNTSNTVNSRNPEYYDDPNTFIPERWLETKSVTERQRERTNRLFYKQRRGRKRTIKDMCNKLQSKCEVKIHTNKILLI